nr:ATP synthase subunit 8 [Monopterus albus]
MPQLNPAPWFYILALSWAVLLLIVPQKVVTLVYLNDPNTKTTVVIQTQSWYWPW